METLYLEEIQTSYLEELPILIKLEYLYGHYSFLDNDKNLKRENHFLGHDLNFQYLYKRIEYKNLNWEDGAKLFKSKGYKNYLTLPSEIIPMEFNRYHRINFYPNGVLYNIFASAQTYNQPQNWTGEVQIPEKDRKNIWIEETFDIFSENSEV